jgi:hypothetical protein
MTDYRVCINIVREGGLDDVWVEEFLSKRLPKYAVEEAEYYANRGEMYMTMLTPIIPREEIEELVRTGYIIDCWYVEDMGNNKKRHMVHHIVGDGISRFTQHREYAPNLYEGEPDINECGPKAIWDCTHARNAGFGIRTCRHWARDKYETCEICGK